MINSNSAKMDYYEGVTHFLTMEIRMEYKCIRVERTYYFDGLRKKIIEKFNYYVLDTDEHIPDMTKTKEHAADVVMVNLPEMVDHPNRTYVDNKFISWYATQILANRL